MRSGFALILASRGDLEVVAEAGDGEEAVALAARHTPHVVLMDVRMPGADGIEATRRILAADAAVRVIMLTTFDADELVHAAVRAGASGFLLKDIRPAELVDAVRVVHHGDALLAPSVTRRLLSRFAAVAPPAAGTPAAARRLAVLTDREREVLTLAARGASNGEIADALVVTEATVKTPRVRDPAQARRARPGAGGGRRLRGSGPTRAGLRLS